MKKHDDFTFGMLHLRFSTGKDATSAVETIWSGMTEECLRSF